MNAYIDCAVLGHLSVVEGSTAWAMRGYVKADRVDISKSLQRLKRKGLVCCDGAFWRKTK